MKSNTYDQATIAYNSKDYTRALKLYYQCLKEECGSFGPGDAGLVYHRIGNCLTKMRNFKEAAASYQKAIQDINYAEKTSIYVNLGTTLNGVGKHEEAVEYFNKALADANYTTRFRAHMGLGGAYTKLGKLTESGIAYRDAALDENNPNPVKALFKLAETFIALDRADDAAEAYLAILDFRVTGDELYKTLDLLGQAYVRAGKYKQGAQTFEEAMTNDRFSLSAQGKELYQKAKLALGESSSIQIGQDPNATAQETGNTQNKDFSGFDVRANIDPEANENLDHLDFNEGDGYGGGNVPHAGDTGFFTLSEDDLIKTGKQSLRKERKLKNTGLKVFLVIIIVLILALGAAVFAFVQGFGFPTKETVVTNFFTTYAADDAKYVDYWIELDQAVLDKQLSGVARSDSMSFVGSGASMTESYLLVSLKLPQGGNMYYRVDLSRDVIGWKISHIEIINASTYDADTYDPSKIFS